MAGVIGDLVARCVYDAKGCASAQLVSLQRSEGLVGCKPELDSGHAVTRPALDTEIARHSRPRSATERVTWSIARFNSPMLGPCRLRHSNHACPRTCRVNAQRLPRVSRDFARSPRLQLRASFASDHEERPSV